MINALKFEEPREPRVVSLVVEWYEPSQGQYGMGVGQGIIDTGRKSRPATMADLARCLGLTESQLRDAVMYAKTAQEKGPV